MSYKSTWYTKRQLSFIADFLNAKLKLSNAERITSSSLCDNLGNEGKASGGYGANIEHKLTSWQVPSSLIHTALGQ